MANLVLKPSTGAGNSVIIKDQGGGAVLTTADSGATIANATLTTPTIASMANCTFPSGHILQVGYATTNNTQSDGTGGTNIAVSDLEVSLTSKVTNGHYFLICHSPYTSANYGSNAMKVFYAVNENNGGYANQAGTSHSVGSFTSTGDSHNGYGYQQLYFNFRHTASLTAGQNIKFRPMYQKHGGGGSDTIFYGTTFGGCTFTVFEIAP